MGCSTHVWWIFGGFHCHRNTGAKIMPRSLFWTTIARIDLHLNFSQQMDPIHSVGPKTYVWWIFDRFRWCQNNGVKAVLKKPLSGHCCVDLTCP